MANLVTTVVLVGGVVGLVVYYGEYRASAKKMAFTTEAISTMGPIREFVEKNGKLPATLEELGIKAHYEVNWDIGDAGNTTKLSHDISLSGGAVVILYSGVSEKGQATLIFRPVPRPGGGVTWDCTEGTLEKEYRITSCKQ